MQPVAQGIGLQVSGRKFISTVIQVFNYEWGLFNSPNLLLFPEWYIFLNWLYQWVISGTLAKGSANAVSQRPAPALDNPRPPYERWLANAMDTASVDVFTAPRQDASKWLTLKCLKLSWTIVPRIKRWVKEFFCVLIINPGSSEIFLAWL